MLEQYGPELFSTQSAFKLRPELRKHFNALAEGHSPYFQLRIPMFQVMPERSGVFYDLSLYRSADYIATSSSVRARYEARPDLFMRQIAFYSELDRSFQRLVVFEPALSGGNTITLYKNPMHEGPFIEREVVSGPLPVNMDQGTSTGSEELFYFELGVIYEAAGHASEAIESYNLAVRYPFLRETTFKNIVLRRTACTLAYGQPQAAKEYLLAVSRLAPTERSRAWALTLAKRLGSNFR